MSQDADGAFVSAFGENPKPFLVARTFADRQDFWVGRWIHAVQIEAQEVGPHELYTLRELVELVVPMVKVVDDADLLGAGWFLSHSSTATRFAGSPPQPP